MGSSCEASVGGGVGGGGVKGGGGGGGGGMEPGRRVEQPARSEGGKALLTTPGRR